MKNTTLCYISRGDSYLMLHRVKKENDLNHDKWIGFGGKMEEDESPEEGIIREIREETGLVPEGLRYRGIVTFVSSEYEGEYMHLFTAEIPEGEPWECDEGETAWIRKTDFAALPQWEGDRIFMKLLEDGAPFFSLKLRYEGDRLVTAILDGKELKL